MKLMEPLEKATQSGITLFDLWDQFLRVGCFAVPMDRFGRFPGAMEQLPLPGVGVRLWYRFPKFVLQSVRIVLLKRLHSG